MNKYIQSAYNESANVERWENEGGKVALTNVWIETGVGVNLGAHRTSLAAIGGQFIGNERPMSHSARPETMTDLAEVREAVRAARMSAGATW